VSSVHTIRRRSVAPRMYFTVRTTNGYVRWWDTKFQDGWEPAPAAMADQFDTRAVAEGVATHVRGNVEDHCE
jgi:hypothetical protein